MLPNFMELHHETVTGFIKTSKYRVFQLRVDPKMRLVGTFWSPLLLLAFRSFGKSVARYPKNKPSVSKIEQLLNQNHKINYDHLFFFQTGHKAAIRVGAVGAGAAEQGQCGRHDRWQATEQVAPEEVPAALPAGRAGGEGAQL